MRLKFYTIDTTYGDYLRKFDHRTPDVAVTRNKENRPFLGVLLEINNVHYFAPLTSPKPKHLKMKNSMDFLKINGGKWGAINFNNMIPVPTNVVHLIDLKILETDSNSVKDYKYLLRNQLSWCNQHRDNILKIANKLYINVTKHNVSQNLLNRCCNFKLLEEKCKDYII